MNITIETNAYNPGRLGKPWIAKVDFSAGPEGGFSWGTWTGDGEKGSEGILSVNADPGDIIGTGQKDQYLPRTSVRDFYEVSITGKLRKLGNKLQAYKHYGRARKKRGTRKEVLQEEKKQLLARIAKINEKLEVIKILEEVKNDREKLSSSKGGIK